MNLRNFKNPKQHKGKEYNIENTYVTHIQWNWKVHWNTELQNLKTLVCFRKKFGKSNERYIIKNYVGTQKFLKCWQLKVESINRTHHPRKGLDTKIFPNIICTSTDRREKKQDGVWCRSLGLVIEPVLDSRSCLYI